MKSIALTLAVLLSTAVCAQAAEPAAETKKTVLETPAGETVQADITETPEAEEVAQKEEK